MPWVTCALSVQPQVYLTMRRIPGEIRSDIAAGDVLISLSGVALAAGSNREQAGRLLDLLMDGLRYRG